MKLLLYVVVANVVVLLYRVLLGDSTATFACLALILAYVWDDVAHRA